MTFFTPTHQIWSCVQALVLRFKVLGLLDEDSNFLYRFMPKVIDIGSTDWCYLKMCPFSYSMCVYMEARRGSMKLYAHT